MRHQNSLCAVSSLRLELIMILSIHVCGVECDWNAKALRCGQAAQAAQACVTTIAIPGRLCRQRRRTSGTGTAGTLTCKRSSTLLSTAEQNQSHQKTADHAAKTLARLLDAAPVTRMSADSTRPGQSPNPTCGFTNTYETPIA